ncbi:MAG: hypothetical protein MZU91_06055 [Desulfosudis oleivorans]|nr:hypothetical protein [Desulfosudis oleivorans]
MLDEVSAASQEQAQGIAQINKAISQMEQVVQANASTAEESASASEELSAQAENMKDIVSSLVELVNGAGAIHQQTYQSISTNKTQKRHLPNFNRRAITSSNDKFRSKRDTHVVNPEEVIPLEDDPQGF